MDFYIWPHHSRSAELGVGGLSPETTILASIYGTTCLSMMHSEFLNGLALRVFTPAAASISDMISPSSDGC